MGESKNREAYNGLYYVVLSGPNLEETTFYMDYRDLDYFAGTCTNPVYYQTQPNEDVYISVHSDSIAVDYGFIEETADTTSSYGVILGFGENLSSANAIKIWELKNKPTNCNGGEPNLSFMEITASISGPSMLELHETGTYTASGTGGNEVYSYVWSRQCNGGSVVSIPSCTTATCYVDMTCTQYNDVTVDVSSEGYSDDATKRTLNSDWARKGSVDQPLAFEISGSFPNPFNPSTEIVYSVPEEGIVTLAIYDFLGREVVRLLDERVHPGQHQVRWEAVGVPSGVYTAQLTDGASVSTRQLVLLK